jgi:hypothetical protein
MKDTLTSLRFPWEEIGKGVNKLIDPDEWSQLRLQKEHWDSHGCLETESPLILRRYLATLDDLREIQECLAQSAYCRPLDDLEPCELLGGCPSPVDTASDVETWYDGDGSDKADDGGYSDNDWYRDYISGWDDGFASDWGSDGWEPDEELYEEDDEESSPQW